MCAGRGAGCVRWRIYGTPRAQGSKRALPRKDGRGVLLVDSSPESRRWRDAVRQVVAEQRGNAPPMAGPIALRLVFVLQRPKSHYRTGRYAGQLKPNAPRLHASKPDIDKLARCVLDALTGVVWRDDAVVAVLQAKKCYGELPGVLISASKAR